MFKKNYKYDIEYDLQGYSDCKNHGCNDEGICRCYKITNIIIGNVNISSISYSIFTEIFDIKSTGYKRDFKINQIVNGYDENINLYGIDRLLRINKIYQKECWKFESNSGYYGEELDSINLIDEVYNNLSIDIEKLISYETLKDKIEFLLIKEYGFLLDKIKNKNYKVFNIKREDISFSQEIYQNKIETNISYYSDKNYELIRGVCLLKDNKWSVIDGYHRLLNTKEEIIKIIGIYD